MTAAAERLLEVASPVVSGPTPAQSEELRRLYRSNRYLEAYQRLEAWQALTQWTNAEGLFQAGRVLNHVGAPRRASWLLLRAYRADRRHIEARYYRILDIIHSRGSWAALHAMERMGPPQGATAEQEADWLLARARIWWHVRDFTRAERFFEEAARVHEESPWWLVERASMLWSGDRYDEALALAQRALEKEPGYRPAVQSAASLLALTGREDEACRLLAEVDAVSSCSAITGQLAGMRLTQQDHAGADRLIRRFIELVPAMERSTFGWICQMRTDIAYGLGDIDGAIHFARGAQVPFLTRMADRLETKKEGKRVLLNVPFVRQHQLTCVPATLSAISRLWRMPADHLKVAEEICYEGTPAHSERRWAEQNGWAVREFTLTYEGATALLDRGIAFTLTLVWPGNAHMQAVIGYDARRETILIRDPYNPSTGEIDIPGLLESHRSTGPRGMAMVPLAQAELLEGLPLADLPARDELNALQAALQKYDRATAGQRYDDLVAMDPESPLTLRGRLALAGYDADAVSALNTTDQLAKKFPDDGALFLQRLVKLQGVGRTAERRALLAEAVQSKEKAHPILWVEHADELMDDARHSEEAARWMGRAIRAMPQAGHAYHSLASLRWRERRFEDAMTLYRISACLDDKRELPSESYFRAARWLTAGQGGGQAVEEALEHLKDRVRRLGTLSSAPAQTLCAAYEGLDRHGEALEVLEEAQRLRPEDGELFLFRAQRFTRVGRLDEAATLLERARGLASENAWLRVAAEVADARVQPREALAHWRAVLELSPLAMDAHRAVAMLLVELEGQPAAIEHTRAAAERFPHHHELHQLWYRYQPRTDLEQLLVILERIVALNSEDAWALREQAIVLAQLGRLDEAFSRLSSARVVAPHDSSNLNVLGTLLQQAGKPEEARQAYRDSLRLSVDSPWTIDSLMSLDDKAMAREDLALVLSEMRRQSFIGEAIGRYASIADDVIAPEELLSQLRTLRQERPELWESQRAVMTQLLSMKRLDEALKEAQQLTDRFPLIAGSWLAVAQVQRARKAADEEKAALHQALRLSSGFSDAARQLAAAHMRDKESEQAIAVLQTALASAPRDSALNGHLASLQWSAGRRDEAIARMQQAIELDPAASRCWETLSNWYAELKRQPELLAFARELDKRRKLASTAYALAQVLDDQPEAALEAVERSLALNPRDIDTYDLKARLLTHLKRYDEAIAACHPIAFGDPSPPSLRGRAAWVMAQRGDRKQAIVAMEAMLADEENRWGTFRLLEWLSEEKQYEALEKRARIAIKIAPESSVPFGYLGLALKSLGQKGEAEGAFHTSLELNASYDYGADQLFDLQFEREDYKAARKTLAMLNTDDWTAFTYARAVRLEAKVGYAAKAREMYRRVFELAGQDEWPIRVATEALEAAGMKEPVGIQLEQAITQADTPDIVPALWVKHVGARMNFVSLWRRLWALKKLSAGGVRVISEYMESIAREGKSFTLFAFIGVYRGLLRETTSLWGQTGYALVTVRAHGQTRRWLRDWRERPKVEAWMLLNLIVAAVKVNDLAEARAVVTAALRLNDPMTERVTAWALFLHALDPAQSPTREEVLAVDAQKLGKFYEFLRDMTLVCISDRAAGRDLLQKTIRSQGAVTSAMIHYRLYHLALVAMARRGDVWDWVYLVTHWLL